MHRINLTIDKDLYEQARAIGFLEKKSISQIVRESLRTYISKPKRRRAALLLSAEDEKKILRIMHNDSFATSKEFKKKFNL